MIQVRIIAVISACAVILFQLFWLHSVYDNQKQMLLKNAQQLLEEEISQATMRKLLGDITFFKKDKTVEKADLRQVLQHPTPLRDNKFLSPLSADRQTRDLVSTGKQIDFEEIADSMSKLLFTLNFPLKKDSPIADVRTLYHSLKLKPMLSQKEFSVVSTSKICKHSVYPTYSAGTAGTDSTGRVYFGLGRFDFYYLVLPNLCWQVLWEIKASVALSVIYVLLSLGLLLLLVRNIAEKRKLIEIRSQFTRNMTHELKTPVATLCSATEALVRFNGLDDRIMTERYLGLMQHELCRLSETIDEVLQIQKLQHISGKPNPTKGTLHSLLEQICTEIKLRIELSNTSVIIEELNHLPPFNFDFGQLKMVFGNLIDNAIKYSGPAPQIQIRASVSSDKITVWISDNGMGIPKQYHKDIFDPFFRVPENDLYTIKGHGLGLTYAHEIIRLHKGTMTLAYSGDKGTCFKIVLPL